MYLNVKLLVKIYTHHLICSILFTTKITFSFIFHSPKLYFVGNGHEKLPLTQTNCWRNHFSRNRSKIWHLDLYRSTNNNSWQRSYIFWRYKRVSLKHNSSKRLFLGNWKLSIKFFENKNRRISFNSLKDLCQWHPKSSPVDNDTHMSFEIKH